MNRPRPIRMLVALIVGANMIALSVLPTLTVFEVVDWTGQQVGIVEALVGTVTTVLVGILAAWQGNGGLTKLQGAFHIIPTESQVTPMSDPRDDGLAPLVPTANDGLDD